ncbi:hypothetical protein CBS101457_000699 [Exobasidium rhododendri]|nr:hypothetical protein CBS101457_000699 [Exobasidium rhododendri]
MTLPLIARLLASLVLTVTVVLGATTKYKLCAEVHDPAHKIYNNDNSVSVNPDLEHWGLIREITVDPSTGERRTKVKGFEHKYRNGFSKFGGLGLNVFHQYTVDPTPTAKKGIYYFELRNSSPALGAPRFAAPKDQPLIYGFHFKDSISRYYYLTNVDTCQIHMESFPDALLNPVESVTVHSIPKK